MLSIENDVINNLVARVFRIEDITTGGEKDQYLVRYRGYLYEEDSAAAYDRLSEALRPHGLTPLFRVEGDRQVVYLVNRIPRPQQTGFTVNLGLLVLTAISVMLSGAMYGASGPVAQDFVGYMLALFSNLWTGFPFAGTLLAILLAHEFGHYLAGRFHKTAVTLPFFIPLPFSLLGTMGAFIQLKEPPRNRRILLDIGIAGPLAGLVVAIPLLLYGLSLSRTGVVSPGGLMEGNSILYLLAKYSIFGQFLPAPSSYEGLPPLLFWLRYVFTGTPSPVGALDVQLHPVAWASWAGLLVTAVNLIPAGQLDGGHLVYTLLGRRRASRLMPFILGVLVMLGFFWSGWWLWAALLFFLGRWHAEPLDQITQLDPRRKWIAGLGLVLFVLLLTPVPLMAI